MAEDIRIKVENQKKMDYAYKEIQKFLKEEFNLTAQIPYTSNNRLSRSLGRFLYRPYTTMINGKIVQKLRDYRIEYNGKFLTHADYDQVAAIGKHEALHFATLTLGLPSNDGSKGFEAMLKKYNLPSQHDNRTVSTASKKYAMEKENKPRYYAKCPKCGVLVAEWLRKPNVHGLQNKVTGCCNVRPEYLGLMQRPTINNLKK